MEDTSSKDISCAHTVPVMQTAFKTLLKIKFNHTVIGVFCVLAIACNGDKRINNGGVPIKVTYGDWIEIDFVSNVLKIKGDELNYVETLHFDQPQIRRLSESFARNKIALIKGTVVYYDNRLVTPLVNIGINFTAGDNDPVEISIDLDHKKTGLSEKSQEKRVTKFKDDIVLLLENNERFRNARDSVVSYQRQLWKKGLK